MTNGIPSAAFQAARAQLPPRSSRAAGSAARRSALIAVIEPGRIGEAVLFQRLRDLGHCPVPFPCVDALVSAAGKGIGFDLVLVPPQPPQRWQQTLLACRGLRLPMVVLAHETEMPTLVDALSAAKRGGSANAEVDFAVLPITDMELACRVDFSAHLLPETTSAGRPATQQFGAYGFHLIRRRVMLHGTDCQLTPREFQVALVLFENAGRVIERERMHRLLWGQPQEKQGSRALDMCVSKLRKKLDLREANGFELISIHKRGYELAQLFPDAARAQRPPATARPSVAGGTRQLHSGDEVFS